MAEVRSVVLLVGWLAGSRAAIDAMLAVNLPPMVAGSLAGSGPRGGGQGNHDGCGAVCTRRTAAPACPGCTPRSGAVWQSFAGPYNFELHASTWCVEVLLGHQLAAMASPTVPRPHYPHPCAELPSVAAEHGHEGGGLKQKAKEVWHGLKEITPGTTVGSSAVLGLRFTCLVRAFPHISSCAARLNCGDLHSSLVLQACESWCHRPCCHHFTLYRSTAPSSARIWRWAGTAARWASASRRDEHHMSKRRTGRKGSGHGLSLCST